MQKAEELFIEALSAFFGQRGAPEVPADEIGRLFALADQQHLFPVIFETLYADGTVRASEKYGAYRNTAIRMAAASEEKNDAFLRLYSRLREEDLHPLIVKGILCRSVFPKGHLRLSSDEDLLVPDDEYDKCAALLAELGYEKTSSDEVTDESGWVSGSCRIELHRSPFGTGDDLAERLNSHFGDVHDNPSVYEIEGGTVLSLTPEAHLVYLLLHAFKHFIRSGFGIRQVCDVGAWIKKYRGEIDFDSVYRICESTNSLVFAKAVFLLAEKVTGVTAPGGAWERIVTDPAPMLEDMLEGGVFGSNDLSRLHSSNVTLTAAGSGKKTRRGVFSAAFPSRDRLVPQYPELKKHPALLPVVWVKRFVKYGRETRHNKGSDTARSLKIAEKRLELLKYYGIIK
ncbi:MAG: nucleotidyltransferase family protein [Clostridia bacterium]|nr:nucleotidyltransferase family protein [Clostridia bacterium]